MTTAAADAPTLTPESTRWISPGLRPLAVPIGSVSPDPANARKHPEYNLQSIRASLERFGQQKPIVCDRERIVRAGNGTLEAAKALGRTSIAAVFSELTPEEIRAYALADNRTGELAEWDDAALRAALESLPADLQAAAGWEGRDLREVLGLEEPEIAEGEAPEPLASAVTRPGDRWILGDHVLLCGDSSKPADVDRLLGGLPIHLVNTDPPYNVRVEPRSNNAIAAGLSSFAAPERSHHQALDLARHPGKAKGTTKKMRAKDRPLANDFVSDGEFDRLLASWFGNIARVLIPGGGFYIWGGYANCGNYPPALKASGLYFSQAVIWDKQHPVLTRKDFMGAHEWCFYGWKEGAAHRFFGPANIPDLWQVKKVNPQSMIHLTEKPVELAARAMEYSSQPGEHVLDLFGGSGSTLMAAQHKGRRGFLMELDPPYCDVIIRRWQGVTKQEATLDGTDQTWAQVAEARKVAVPQES